MSHRNDLPQMEDRIFLTDGGIETTLIFHDGFDLPYFAAFDLLRTDRGRVALRAYFRRYAAIARTLGTGLVLESATWRASPDWGALLGYGPDALAVANRQAIELLADVRAESGDDVPVVLSGCIGPRGDGYVVDKAMTAEEAAAYHDGQVGVFAQAEADMVSAITMTYVDEAVGIARAARAHGMPVAISFTVETDGRLPSGQALAEAVSEVDTATGGYPAYYMINCAHPSHFHDVIDGAEWTRRIGGVRANASRMSHAELDEATKLDDGEPSELAGEYAELMARLPRLRVLGGCCGTDHRHVEAIGRRCVGAS